MCLAEVAHVEGSQAGVRAPVALPLPNLQPPGISERG